MRVDATLIVSLASLPAIALSWCPNECAPPRSARRHSRTPSTSRPSTSSSSTDLHTDPPPPPVYAGPPLQDPSEIVAGITLGELGLDLAVAPSTVAPGTLGLYAILSEGAESATIPALSLLCGYSREGTFLSEDEGDKTVGFALAGPDTAVFYERRLMSAQDALELAAETRGKDRSCGLAGHALVQNEDTEEVEIYLDEDPGFGRYFVPAFLNDNLGQEDEEDGELSGELSVQNFGQFCNDLAWSYDAPPNSKEEYDAASLEKNVVQLVWRLDFDPDTKCLVPSWPVSVLAHDMTFKNAEVFMELGTRYGWNYWQATVDLGDS